MLLGATGPNNTVNSLCASGTDSLGSAANFIRLGYADVMIAGGADASLNPVSLAGIDILGALTHETDPTKASRPFDLNRSGFVYGEGAGIVVLEHYEHAIKRGAPILVSKVALSEGLKAFRRCSLRTRFDCMGLGSALLAARRTSRTR